MKNLLKNTNKNSEEKRKFRTMNTKMNKEENKAVNYNFLNKCSDNYIHKNNAFNNISKVEV